MYPLCSLGQRIETGTAILVIRMIRIHVECNADLAPVPEGQLQLVGLACSKGDRRKHVEIIAERQELRLQPFLFAPRIIVEIGGDVRVPVLLAVTHEFRLQVVLFHLRQIRWNGPGCSHRRIELALALLCRSVEDAGEVESAGEITANGPAPGGDVFENRPLRLQAFGGQPDIEKPQGRGVGRRARSRPCRQPSRGR